MLDHYQPTMYGTTEHLAHAITREILTQKRRQITKIIPPKSKWN